jgi:hypothetical protein
MTVRDNIWDLVIALSGIDDYLVAVDPKAKELTLATPDQIKPDAPVIEIDDKRWQRIAHGTKH